MKALCFFGMIQKANLKEKFSLFSDQWHPRIIGQVNDTHIKLARLKGEFDWHHHDSEDEMFYVVGGGNLTIELEDGMVELKSGEMAVIPRGVEHRPVARDEALVMLVEPVSTVNTGNIKSEKTVDAQWI